MAAIVRSFALGDDARRARRVGFRHRLQSELAQRAAALAERLRMAQHALDRSRGSRRASPSAGGARAGSARRRCRDRRRAADDGCRRRGRRPNSRSGSWRSGRRPTSPPASASSNVGQAIGFKIGKGLAAGEMRIGARLALIGDARSRSFGVGSSARLRRRASSGGCCWAWVFENEPRPHQRASACGRVGTPDETAGALKIGRSIDTERNGVNDRRRRCACRLRARAVARASRASRAATAAARRSVRGCRGDRRRCRCDGRAGLARRARWRA